MSSDDDTDYMSDEFLVKCLKSGSSGDIRPGLIRDRTKQRQVDIQKRKADNDEENRKRYKPYAQKEAERREEGLREAIPTSNKGFALLQKMGYQPGIALGKSGKGPVEPVCLKVKSGRGGLGRETAMQEIAEAKSLAVHRWRLKRKEEAEVGTKDYRMRVAAEARRRQAEGDLRVSQKACLHLDDENGYSAPLEKWFWPEIKISPDEESSSESEEVGNSDEENSSGRESSEHESTAIGQKRNKGGRCSKSSKKEKVKEDDENELQPEEKLDILTEYLRKTYLFCTWCGTKFDGEEDLAANCPGKTRDDH